MIERDEGRPVFLAGAFGHEEGRAIISGLWQATVAEAVVRGNGLPEARQRDGGGHVEMTREEKIAAPGQHRATACLGRGVKRLLQGSRVVGLAIGSRAEMQTAKVVFIQMASRQFEGSQQTNLRRTFRHVAFLLDRLLANMGVSGAKPLLERFNRPVDATKAETRWLDAFYHDQPEERDDPDRFFRW